ncbi:unnamed protein product [Caretta caretta]
MNKFSGEGVIGFEICSLSLISVTNGIIEHEFRKTLKHSFSIVHIQKGRDQESGRVDHYLLLSTVSKLMRLLRESCELGRKEVEKCNDVGRQFIKSQIMHSIIVEAAWQSVREVSRMLSEDSFFYLTPKLIRIPIIAAKILDSTKNILGTAIELTTKHFWVRSHQHIQVWHMNSDYIRTEILG